MVHKYGFVRFWRAAGLSLALLAAGCAGFGRGQEKQAGKAMTEIASNGVFEGRAQGRRGPVRVMVRMEEGLIAEIDIVESGEDRFVGGAAMEELLDLALAYNSTDLDVISGATESSKAFLEAVEDAIMRSYE